MPAPSPEVSVVGKGVLVIDRDMSRTCVPREIEKKELDQQIASAEKANDQVQANRCRDLAATCVEQIVQRKAELASVTPIVFAAEILTVQGILDSDRRERRKRRVSNGDKEYTTTDITDITTYDVVRLRRYDVSQYLLYGSHPGFWEREQQRLFEVLNRYDKKQRSAWNDCLYRASGYTKEDLERLGLSDDDVLLIPHPISDFRVDVKSLQNNGYRYVKPSKRHPRPLDLTWTATFKDQGEYILSSGDPHSLITPALSRSKSVPTNPDQIEMF